MPVVTRKTNSDLGKAQTIIAYNDAKGILDIAALRSSSERRCRRMTNQEPGYIKTAIPLDAHIATIVLR